MNNKEKNEKKDLLMDAMGNINPQYIEEARQAVSDGTGPKSTPAERIRRLVSSPFCRFSAAACLMLIICISLSQSGILPDIFSDISKKNSRETTVFSNSDLSRTDLETENLSESAANLSVLTEPPSLNLFAMAQVKGTEKETDSKPETAPEQNAVSEQRTDSKGVKQDVSTYSCSADSITALQNSYQWTCDAGNDQQRTTIADCPYDIWNSPDLPVLTLTPGETIHLEFTGNPPDSLSIRYLSASEISAQVSDTSRWNYMEVQLQEDNSISLPLEDNWYVVEISADWDNDLYYGSCIYGFRAEYTE